MVIADKIGFVVTGKVLLQGSARRIQRIQILMLQQKRDTGFTVAQGVVHFNLIGVGYIPNQIRKALGGFLGAEVPLPWGSQLNDGNDIPSPGTGIPALYQLTCTHTRVGLCIHLLRQLFLSAL